MRTFLIRAAFVLILAGAAFSISASEISVVVTDAHNNPIEKARVTCFYPTDLPYVGPGSEETFTKDGAAHFVGIHAGTYRVRVEKTGFIPVELSEIVFDAKAQKAAYLTVFVVLNPSPAEVERGR